MTTSTVSRTRKLTGVAMLSAVSVVLSFLSFPVPLMPSFIKLDFAELPALIAAFAYGPISGVAVCLVKNLIALLKTSSGGIGTLCNFLLGVSFVVPAGIVYLKKRSRSGALIGALVMASLDNGMSMLDVDAYWQMIVKGLILTLAVWV